jgi:hypothetical protein
MPPSDDERPAGDEELLETGGRGERRRLGRMRLDLAIGAVVLGGALVVARLISDNDASTGARPAPTPSPSPSARTYGTGAPDSGSGLLNGMATATLAPSDGRGVTIPARPGRDADDPFRCPESATCTTVESAAAPVRAAVRAAFPGAVLEAATTVRMAGRPAAASLWFLQVNALVGSREILVRVQVPTSRDVEQGNETETAHGTTAYLSTGLRQYHVTVQVDGPAGREQPFSALQKLATDVRLLAPA